MNSPDPGRLPRLSIINGVGGPVTSTNPGTVEPVDLVSYP